MVQLGEFFGSFVLSLLFPVVWLLICKAIPFLRCHLKVSYGIAIVFAFVPALTTIGGPTITNMMATALTAALLSSQYYRAKSTSR